MAKKDKKARLVHGTWFLRIRFRGTNYAGWQSQGEGGLTTVQSTVENALRQLFNDPQLMLNGSGRTDAGVHALGMAASFETDFHPSWTGQRLMDVINWRMPQDIAIVEAEPWPDNLHARFSARGKTYVYALNVSAGKQPFFEDLYYRHERQFDVAAMRQAARVLTGTHDFTAFAANKKVAPMIHKGEREPAEMRYLCPPKPTGNIRSVYQIEITEKNGFIFFSCSGSGFLYKMVRSLVGHLLWVGEGRCSWEDTAKILAGKVRTNEVETAPAQGLYLAKVYYQPDQWASYDVFQDDGFPLKALI